MAKRRLLPAAMSVGATMMLTVGIGSPEATADTDRPIAEVFRVSEVAAAGPGGGNRLDDFALAPDVNHDGTVFAYGSAATNIPGASANGIEDIFVFDHGADTTSRITIGHEGADADGDSRRPSLDDSGQLVAFHSAATNLVGDDTNGQIDVFVHDRTNGTTTNLTAGGNGPSRAADINGPGTHVAFMSKASNLVAGDTNRDWDIFIVELSTGDIVRVSVRGDGTEADDLSRDPAISDDANRIAFRSDAENLVDDNIGGGVFVHDRSTITTTRVARPPARSLVDGVRNALPVDISGDGRYVVYTQRDIGTSVFVADLETASPPNAGVESTLIADDANNPSINDDGTRMTYIGHSSINRFQSRVSGSGFVLDLTTGTTAVAHRQSPTAYTITGSGIPSISGDGRTLTYTSLTPLLPGIEPPRFGHSSEVYATRVPSLTTNDVCGGFFATIGGTGPIVGTSGFDVIVGSDGPDTIDGLDKTDLICGLGGDDVIRGGAGSDIVFGGDGDDIIDGGTAWNRLFGGDGNDTIDGQAGWSMIEGGAGDDKLLGGTGRDEIDGGPGNDRIEGGGDRDRLFGREGNDALLGGSGDDTLSGGDGDDTLRGGPGDDSHSGGSGADQVIGGPGSDIVWFSGSEAGVIVTLNGRADDGQPGEGDNIDLSIESIWGTDFDDVLVGSAGDETLWGRDGDDRLVGRGGNDILLGGHGNDFVIGGPGDDSVFGGYGNDVLVGGDGVDEHGGGRDFDVCITDADDVVISNCEETQFP